jgi:fermentation-respiration switch protein FrsA (DUF1100 family)
VRRLLTVIAIVVLLAVIWTSLTTAWLWKNQERVVFQPPADAPDAPAPARRVAYRASDGHELFGYLLQPADSVNAKAGRVVIAFHGNADLSAWTAPWAHELSTRAGLTVLVPEYRGYGGITGEPTYETATADARGALAFARDSLKAAEIVIYGHSLGTAIGADLAAHMGASGPRSLVLQSPFTSARDMATRMMVPPIPGLWPRISRVHYDTRAIVANLDAPVFVSHGTRDLNIPARMGRQVFDAARVRGDLLLVDGAGHNDVADAGGEAYWTWLVKAVRQ